MVDLMVLTLFESSQEYAELSVDIAQYSRLVLEFISANSPDMRKLFECLVDEEMCSTFSSRPITKGKRSIFSLPSYQRGFDRGNCNC
jgi:hypothetical protein